MRLYGRWSSTRDIAIVGCRAAKERVLRRPLLAACKAKQRDPHIRRPSSLASTIFISTSENPWPDSFFWSVLGLWRVCWVYVGGFVWVSWATHLNLPKGRMQRSRRRRHHCTIGRQKFLCCTHFCLGLVLWIQAKQQAKKMVERNAKNAVSRIQPPVPLFAHFSYLQSKRFGVV